MLALIFICLPYKYTDDVWLSPRLEALRIRIKEPSVNTGKRRSSKGWVPTIVNTDVLQGTLKPRDHIWAKFVQLLRNPMFTSITLTLSVLWFIVTGVQYWATEFFISEFKVNRGLVVAMFAIVSLTGPTLGVVVGGLVTDARGGYNGRRARKRTLRQ